jgi:hypothetical protein
MNLLNLTEVVEFLVSDYGLTKREALFTCKLVEGKSVTAAGQESSIPAREVQTTLNRVLLKVTDLFPVQVNHKHQGAAKGLAVLLPSAKERERRKMFTIRPAFPPIQLPKEQIGAKRWS